MLILIIDNYDSFTYNIAQYVGELGAEPLVYRNDKISINEIKELDVDAIIISPGPGHPANARDFGVSRDVILELHDKMPILGVCLGHQGIVHIFGGKVIHAKMLRHGKTSIIKHNEKDIFANVKNPFRATRYHSLVADKNIPDQLEVTARSIDDGEVMGIKHKKYPLYGVQFHPESVLTDEGKKILMNFLSIVKR
ncbi:MAG: aminodeoxychorismate/anthranilate synthase component II [Candidatus Nitrosothermus koennekii]|nr:MAG: aminodeoxychorismate/anthranilate synthase component II [Candidatus Nitrosothermus koennekii]